MSGIEGSIVKDESWDQGAWTQVPNDVARDRVLSLEAKGLILFMASHSINYKIHLETLRLHVGVGREKLQRILKELKGAGYLQTEATWQKVDGRNRRGPNQYKLGRFRTSVDTTGFQADEDQTVGNPTDEDLQMTGFQTAGVQTSEVQGAGNQTSFKKNNTKKNNQKKNNTTVGAAAASPEPRGHRLPEDFQVTPAMVAWCRETFPLLDGRNETEKFREYWLAVPGQRGRKLNWEMTWKRWMRTAAERQGTRRGRGARIQRQSNGLVMDL